MSSVVLASQLQPAKKSAVASPLIRDGKEIIPNVTHVFSAGQHLLLTMKFMTRAGRVRNLAELNKRRGVFIYYPMLRSLEGKRRYFRARRWN